MNIDTSGTSSRDGLEKQVEDLRVEVKYLQDQINGRPQFAGMTGDKFPGGLPQGSVIAAPADGGGLTLSTVGPKGRVDATMTIGPNSSAFGGFVTSISTDTVPEGSFVIYSSSGQYDIYVNESGTPTPIGNAGFGGVALVRRDSSGEITASGFNIQASGVYTVNGVQVVQERQPAIADSAAASFAAVNTKINEILTALRAHGLIST